MVTDPPPSPSWPSHTSDSSREPESPIRPSVFGDDSDYTNRITHEHEELPRDHSRGVPTIVHISPSAQHEHFAFALTTFLSQPFVRIPTSAEGLHCGADALRLVLSRRFPAPPITKEQVIDTIQIMVEDLDDFRVDSLDDDDMTSPMQNLDLLSRPDHNFYVDQLARAVAIIGARCGCSNLVLGVVTSDLWGSAEVQMHDYRIDKTCNEEDVEAVWVWHSLQHWEALVPQSSHVGGKSEGQELLRFVLEDEEGQVGDRGGADAASPDGSLDVWEITEGAI